MTDLFDSMPTELVKASEDICLWFAERNINKWALGGLQSREALQAEPEPVAYITQAALDALKRGASSSVRVWRNPDEPNGDVALYTKENLNRRGMMDPNNEDFGGEWIVLAFVFLVILGAIAAVGTLLFAFVLAFKWVLLT